MTSCITVENISCDRCGNYGSQEEFPDIYTDSGKETLRKFGWNLEDPADNSEVQTRYAGAICPHCGNFSEFDFDPDRKKFDFEAKRKNLEDLTE
jgi:hypothetical protein